jgi:hypothetical protein
MHCVELAFARAPEGQELQERLPATNETVAGGHARQVDDVKSKNVPGAHASQVNEASATVFA